MAHSGSPERDPGRAGPRWGAANRALVNRGSRIASSIRAHPMPRTSGSLSSTMKRLLVFAFCSLTGCHAATTGEISDGSSDASGSVSGDEKEAVTISDGQAGSPSCPAVHATTDSGTCPVTPPNGALCDLSETPSGFCGAPDCAPNAGCCGSSVQPGQTCFSTCGPCPSRDVACVAAGACQKDSDCQGALPHLCQNCPLAPDGQPSQGCAHWTCNAGQCEVDYCPSGLVCAGWQGCPSYYLPSVDRTCGADTDCTLVDHVVSCCVTTRTAVRVSEAARFKEVESECSAIHDQTFYECGCPGSTVTEDGGSPGLGQSFAAACVSGTCTAVIRGRLQCGTASCAEGESCCVSLDATGRCVYSCAASCPVHYDDAGAMISFGCSTGPGVQGRLQERWWLVRPSVVHDLRRSRLHGGGAGALEDTATVGDASGAANGD